MAEVKWIKIHTGIFDDEKIKLIDSMPDRDAIIVVWIKLLTLAGKVNDNGVIYVSEHIPYTEEMYSAVFNRPLNTVRMALETFKKFNMIDIFEGHTYISNWEKHQNIEGLEKIREQERLRKAKQRERQKELELQDDTKKMSRDSHGTVTQCHATDIDKNKIKNKINIIKEKDKEKKFNFDEINKLEITEELKIKLIEFCKYREELKKPIKTITTINSILKMIGKDYQSEKHLMESIDWSISQGWQGIFSKGGKINSGTGNGKTETISDEERRKNFGNGYWE